MPATSREGRLRRRTKRCRNPVIKTVVAAGLGRGAYAGSANESKPDGGRPPREIKGNAPNPGCSGENRNPEGSSAGESVRSRFGRTVSLSGTRLPASSGGGGCSASEKNNRAMTGAHLSHHASRRADGLATSAVLEQKPPTSLGKACELSPARNPDAAMLRKTRHSGESRNLEGHTPSIKRAQNHPSPFCVSKRGTRSEANAGGSCITAHSHGLRWKCYSSKPSCGFVHGARAVHAFGRGKRPS